MILDLKRFKMNNPPGLCIQGMESYPFVTEGTNEK